MWGAGPVPRLELDLVEGARPSPEPLLDSGGVGSALGAGPVVKKMKDSLKRYEYERDCLQSFSVTRKAKYEMHTCRRSHEEIFIDVHINKLPLYVDTLLHTNIYIRMHLLLYNA